jgi:hypothetical protein
VARPYTWDELTALTLPRLFPRVRGRATRQVVDLIGRLGPIQSQSARAPYLSMAARLPGVTKRALDSAHEALSLVRSTSLRGTVHTSTREQHALLAAVATPTFVPAMRRLMGLDDAAIAGLRSEIERLAADGWTPHAVLMEGVVDWLRSRGLDRAIASLDRPGGRYVARTHPAMLRRPPPGGRWDSQVEVLYQTAGVAIHEHPLDPQASLVALVRHHIAAAGPVTRRDLAWWSGVRLGQVDAALTALADELTSRPGPNGLQYVDLVSPTRSAMREADVRLLPEYDAVLLAYDPAARGRFADDEAIAYSWNKRNGVHSPTVFMDGRLRGLWQILRSGNDIAITVRMLPSERLLDPSDLAAAASSLAAALDVTVTDVIVERL